MSRALYACGLCCVGAALSLYISMVDHSPEAWLCSVGFLAVGGFLWAVDWILASSEQAEYREEE